jgi:predicted glycosyltransferase
MTFAILYPEAPLRSTKPKRSFGVQNRSGASGYKTEAELRDTKPKRSFGIQNRSGASGYKMRILVTPLNWGLGHATRSAPIISALLDCGCEVILASDGAALQMLRAEFPTLESHELPSWNVRYFSENMIWNVARQFPKMAWAVRREQWATERLVQDLKIDLVISDNRYGCFSRHVPSVILTHQLRLKVPFRPLEIGANWLLKRVFRPFSAIFVPDFANEPNLSGELSHGYFADFPPIHYVGLLSRMSRKAAIEPLKNGKKIAVLLSGPEPMRTILEKKLLEQAVNLTENFIFIQGKPAQKQHFLAAKNVEVVSFLTAADLQKTLELCEIVICRSGYSSLMDLVQLRKKALLIPTPGQTEQAYLAKSFEKMGGFIAQNQSNIDLKKGISDIRAMPEMPPIFEQKEDLAAVLAVFLNKK